MRVAPVDGYLGENLIVFGDLRGGHVGRGYEIVASDLENADPVHHNALERDLIALLAVLKPHQRLQVQWGANGGFRRPLLKFRQKTRERAKNKWTERVRDEIFVRGWEQEDAGLLRCEQLRVYVTDVVDGHVFGGPGRRAHQTRSEEHTSELQSPDHLVCRLLLEK